MGSAVTRRGEVFMRTRKARPSRERAVHWRLGIWDWEECFSWALRLVGAVLAPI